MRTPAQIQLALDRLRLLRHRLVQQSETPRPGESFVPILTANAEVCAIDVALDELRARIEGAT